MLVAAILSILPLILISTLIAILNFVPTLTSLRVRLCSPFLFVELDTTCAIVHLLGRETLDMNHNDPTDAGMLGFGDAGIDQVMTRRGPPKNANRGVGSELAIGVTVTFLTHDSRIPVSQDSSIQPGCGTAVDMNRLSPFSHPPEGGHGTKFGCGPRLLC